MIRIEELNSVARTGWFKSAQTVSDSTVLIAKTDPTHKNVC